MKKFICFIMALMLLLIISGCKKDRERLSEPYSISSKQSSQGETSSDIDKSETDNVISENWDLKKENKQTNQNTNNNSNSNSQKTTVDIPEVGNVEVTTGNNESSQDNSQKADGDKEKDSSSSNESDSSDKNDDSSKSESSSDGWTKGYY